MYIWPKGFISNVVRGVCRLICLHSTKVHVSYFSHRGKAGKEFCVGMCKILREESRKNEEGGRVKGKGNGESSLSDVFTGESSLHFINQC